MKKATSKQTKYHNRDLVLRTIFTHDPISRAEVSRITHLTKTTVSDIVSVLLDQGLIAEIGKGESLGGKNPTMLSLMPDSRCTIGLNLSQNKFMGAIVNLRGEIKQKIEVTIHDENGENALTSVYKILDELMRACTKNLVGIGVGAPGLIDSSRGIVVNAVNLDWHNLELGKLLTQRYNKPVSVLNDSQATAIGEFVYNPKNKLEENYIVVNVNQGIGAGILINGKLFRGDTGWAGEIGHVVIAEDGEICRCGKRGCLETIASTRAVIRHLNASSIDEVITAYNQHDERTRQVVNHAAHYLGISLANMIGMLNIHKLVLTGEMVRFGEDWLEAVKSSMQAAALTSMIKDTTIEIGKFGFDACILGAAAFLLLDDYSLLHIKDN